MNQFQSDLYQDALPYIRSEMDNSGQIQNTAIKIKVLRKAQGRPNYYLQVCEGLPHRVRGPQKTGSEAMYKAYGIVVIKHRYKASIHKL